MTCVHLVAMHSLRVAPYHPHFLSWTPCQMKTADLPGVPAEGADGVQISSLMGATPPNLLVLQLHHGPAMAKQN